MTAPLLAEGVIVALGARRLIGAYTLAGVELRVAEDDASARAAWQALGRDVALVILTADAADAIGAEIDAVGAPLTAVMPA